MAHPVVAVNHGHGRTLMHHADIGVFVDAACLNAIDVLRQSNDAVAIGAL
jgi:hypothetical protein